MPIGSKALEDILIAKSLGTLSPEAEVLLADYLERNPSARLPAKQYDEVVELARAAVGGDEKVSLPAFPVKAIRGAMVTRRRYRRFWRGAAVAASLMIGMGLGMVLKNETPGKMQMVYVSPAVSEKSKARTEPENSFWSVKLSSLREGASKRSSARLIWKSITQKPEIGGEL